MLKAIFTFLAVVFLFNVKANAQDDSWMPPKPVENAVLESMVGTWTGTSDMGGMKMNDELKAYWALNHQFLILEVKSTSPTFNFSGTSYYSVDADGSVRNWWFDDWGTSGVMTGSGKFDGMSMTVTSSNATMTDTRTVSFKDANMIMSWNSVMKMHGGTDFTMKGETVYTKR